VQKEKRKYFESKRFLFYVITIAESLRTGCNVLGDKILKKIRHPPTYFPYISPAHRVAELSHGYWGNEWLLSLELCESPRHAYIAVSVALLKNL